MIKSYFYTETAFHHEGDIEYLKSLIIDSYEAGANGIKFQVMTNTSDFISKNHSAYSKLHNYSFTKNEWLEIFRYTENLGLDIIMMPLNIEALELANQIKIKFIDIHSVSFYDDELMDCIKKSKIDIILGVGGRTIEEIQDKINFFNQQLKILMVGFQSFPSKLEQVKIGKISFLKKMFPKCKIGYADHSSFDSKNAVESNYLAKMLGASYFEKHITINEGIERVDYSSAIGKEKIQEIINQLSFIDNHVLTSYSDCFSFHENELIYRNRQLICVAARDLKSNEILTKNDIHLKLIDTNEPEVFNKKSDLINKKLISDIDEDQIISKSNIL